MKAELDEKDARDIQVERAVATPGVAGSEATLRDFEETNKSAAGVKFTAGYPGVQSVAATQSVPTEGSLSTLDRGANDSGGLVAEPGPGGYMAGDTVEALCTPVGAPPGVKQYIQGEVAHRNPDGSVDVILSDGRMRPEVPPSELRFIGRLNQGEPDGDGVVSSSNGLTPGVPPESGVPEGFVGGADTVPVQRGYAASGGRAAAMALSDDGEGRFGGNGQAAKEQENVAVYHGNGNRNRVTGEGRVNGAVSVRKGTLDDILGIKMAATRHGGTKTVLEKGDVVKTVGASATGGSATSLVGVISHQYEDDCYDIELKDGGMATRLPRSDVLLVRKGQPQSSSSFTEGDRVEARYDMGVQRWGTSLVGIAGS